MAEEHSWKKWFAGMVDPTAYSKTLAVLLRIVLILLIFASVVIAILWLKQTFLNKKAGSPVKIDSISGGNVHNSSDDNRKKFCFIFC